MDPNLLHKQLRDNANDYTDFYKELKQWGDEMKRREDQLQGTSHNTKNGPKSPGTAKRMKSNPKVDDKKSAKKFTTTDYSAWDKFNAEAECEKIDENDSEESELTDEFDATQKEEAFVEKEKGNKWVKNQKWDEAIACYTKAISLHAYDPIFYANRALCHLKKHNMEKAEHDCTLSLKLDSNYVKAYQRRAAAREALNKLEEAAADLKSVLIIEPNNTESKRALEIVTKKLASLDKPRPVSKFTASRSTFANNLQKQCIQPTVNATKGGLVWPSGDDDIMLVGAINKPVHLRSKKPLKRIEIVDVEGFHQEPDKSTAVVQKKPEAFPQVDSCLSTLKTDDLKIIERKEIPNSKDVKVLLEEHELKSIEKTGPSAESKPLESPKETKNNTNTIGKKLGLVAPKNSVQFSLQWKQLKTFDSKYAYLKLIKPEDLPDIFKDSFESSIFTQILTILSEHFIKNRGKVYEFLYYFTEIKRFGAFTMFMDEDDKKRLWKLLDYVKDVEGRSNDEVQLLIKKYEL